MSASNTKLGEIAAQAERDLNTYQAKTGNARYQGVDEAGVDSMADRKFADMGAQVKYHPEISTNAGWNKRIPPEEGGERDDRGRETRGEHFEGVGGPEEKVERKRRDYGGYDDNDALPPEVLNARDITGPGKERRGNDILDQGASASRANVGQNPPGPGGEKFRGSDYFKPEEVPDSIAAEGYVAPESVTQSSRETEGY